RVCTRKQFPSVFSAYHPKNTPPGPGRGPRENLRDRVPGFPPAPVPVEILRGCLAAIGHELVLDSLPLVERVETSALDRRDVDEDVLFSARGPNEPVAFSWIEPFDGALLHRLSPSQ